MSVRTLRIYRHIHVVYAPEPEEMTVFRCERQGECDLLSEKLHTIVDEIFDGEQPEISFDPRPPEGTEIISFMRSCVEVEINAPLTKAERLELVRFYVNKLRITEQH